MINEEVLKIVLNGMTFSRTDAIKIVGGAGRLEKYVSNNMVREYHFSKNLDNRYRYNAWDVVKNGRCRGEYVYQNNSLLKA